jgi:hypothetical protein
MNCDLCGEPMNPTRDAIGKLGLEPLIIEGKAAKHAHLGCYRLNREFLERGINPLDVQREYGTTSVWRYAHSLPDPESEGHE